MGVKGLHDASINYPYFLSYISYNMADTVAYGSVHWTPGQEAWVQDLAGSMHCIIGKDTFLSQHLSLPRSLNEFWQNVREA